MSAIDINILRLSIYYLMLIIPLGLMLWLQIPIIGRTLISIVRMTLQLTFIGLYLQVVFKINSPWLNFMWLLVMVGVADLSIIRSCGLRLSRFVLPLFLALTIGTIVPLFFFIGTLLRYPNIMEAQYVIPIGGMILGNCLRADIIGVRSFFESIKKSEKYFLHTLSQGASLKEASLPYLREAYESALMPTIATISTIGLVSLPGMMTGVILGGASPITAIKYQIAIMIAILSGTAITVVLAIFMSIRTGFTRYGVLDRTCFAK